MDARWPEWVTPSGRPELVPHFPADSFTPSSSCPHRGPYPVGSVLCCMKCHKSGMDGADVMRIDPREEPKPEPKVPEPVQAEKPKSTKTSGKMRRRKAKRAMQGAA